jgi:3-oxoacyl-[acyl-carrier protein] reductase
VSEFGGTLAGRVAVVTGTAQGIGRAVAQGIRDAGGSVHEVDKDDVDLSVSGAVEEFFAAVGDVDVLVNVAGGVCGQTHVPIDELSDEAWDAVVDANLRTTLNCTRAAARSMKRRRYGRIVNISSGAGRSVSLTGIQAYTSAKAAQIGFTRQMAHELGPHGITVNCLCPGPVVERAEARAHSRPEFATWSALSPLGRLGEPADVARAALFLASNDADYLTGDALNVAGGMVLH